MAATVAAAVLVFGELAWRGGAEGGQISLFLAAAHFQTPSVACEAALANLGPGGAAGSVAAPALQPPLDFRSC